MAEVAFRRAWRRPLTERGRAVGEGHGRSIYPDSLVVEVRTWHETERIGCRRLHARWRERFPTGPRPSLDWVRSVLSYRTRATPAARALPATTPSPVAVARLARDACADAGAQLGRVRTVSATGHMDITATIGERTATLRLHASQLRTAADPIEMVARMLTEILR